MQFHVPQPTLYFYFHICCQEERFYGSGPSAYAAYVAALGTIRAARFAQRTHQTHYMHGENLARADESAVANVLTANGRIVASITRLVQR
jgi:hypothetical protein